MLWRCVVDPTAPPPLSSRSETLIEHGAAGDPAVLVGTDQHGNKYFEKREAQMGEKLLLRRAANSNCSVLLVARLLLLAA